MLISEDFYVIKNVLRIQQQPPPPPKHAKIGLREFSVWFFELLMYSFREFSVVKEKKKWIRKVTRI